MSNTAATTPQSVLCEEQMSLTSQNVHPQYQLFFGIRLLGSLQFGIESVKRQQVYCITGYNSFNLFWNCMHYAPSEE